MKQILICACLFCSIYSYGQDNAAATIILEEGAQMEQQIKKLSSPIGRSSTQNLFLNPAWQNSAVIGKEGKVTYFNGRFNVLDNAIELKNKNGLRVIRPSQVKAAMVGDKYFIVVPAEQTKAEISTSFFEVLSLGTVNLYSLHILKTRTTGSNALTTAFNGGKEYFISEELHYQRVGESCQKLKTNEKKILLIFEDQQDKVQAFGKEHNLKYRPEADLIRLFDYYNSLNSGNLN